MSGFLDGLKNFFKTSALPTLGIGFAVGAIFGKKSAQNNNIFGFGFDSNGNYDAYIGSGRPHGYHRHHGGGRGYSDFKDFQRFQRFQDYKYSNKDHHRFNYCPMDHVQTRPYNMHHDWRNGPKAGGLTIGTGDDGNIFIGGDLKGKKVTIYQ